MSDLSRNRLIIVEVKNNRLHLDGYWAYEARILNRIIQEAGQEDVTIPDRLTQEKSDSGTISIHVKLPPKPKKEKKKREEPPSKPKVTPKVKSPVSLTSIIIYLF